MNHQKVKIVAQTIPVMEDNMQISTIEDFIVYAARVSNPESQVSNMNNERLLNYLITHDHWSPLEMASLTMEISTTRDIARQMLRHRSFSFQEFSQRYAAVIDPPVLRECRMQDMKNRQNSTINDDEWLDSWWENQQLMVSENLMQSYQMALEKGIAKEQARALLPEGMTPSKLYMAGNIRSWVHYCKLRGANGTQKEHMDIANKAKTCLLEELPSLRNYFDEQGQ